MSEITNQTSMQLPKSLSKFHKVIIGMLGSFLFIIALGMMFSGTSLTQAQQDALTLLDLKDQYKVEAQHNQELQAELAASDQKLLDISAQAQPLSEKLGF